MISHNSFYEFNGGLKLTSEQFAHRGSSIDGPVVTMPAPEFLYFPLQVRASEPLADVCVSIGETVEIGQPLTRNDNPSLPPTLASCCGTIENITANTTSNPATPAVPHIKLRTTGGANQRLHPSTMIDAEKPLYERIHLAGIRGLGGASFPSHLKLTTSSNSLAVIKTLIINAVECEPLISCDEALMKEQSEEIVQAIHFLCHESRCNQCLIGIEDDKPDAIARISAALTKYPDDRIKLIVIPAKFPTGGERQLIKTLTNKEVPYGSLPASLGIVCFNVATALAIKQALLDQQPFRSRIVSVTGTAVQKPVNVQTIIGTSIRELIDFAAPNTINTARITIGGPVSGRPLKDHNHPVTAAVNCVLVESATAESTEALACIRCGDCNNVCPQSLLPQQLYWYSQAANYTETERFKLDACIECGCCDLVCPSNIPLTPLFRETKSTIIAQHLAAEFAQRSKERFEKREARLQQRAIQRQQRIRQRKAEIDAKKTTDPKEAVKAALARAKRRKPPATTKPDNDSSAT